MIDSVQAADLGLLYFFGSWHRPWLDPLVGAITQLGNPWPMTGLVIALVGLFALLRRYRLALVMVFIGLAAGGLQQGAKYIVNRPRPEVVWRQIDLPNQPSFPSGHASGSMGIYLGAALLARRLIASRLWAGLLIAAAVLLALAIGLTRPYLGVHYPLDVFTGWLTGLVCAFVGDALAGPGAGTTSLERTATLKG